MAETDSEETTGRPDGDQALQDRLLAALHAAGTGTWRWDIVHDRVEWDEPLSRIYGVDPDQSPRNAAEFLSFVHPADQAYVSAVIRAAVEQGVDPDYEFRALLPDGTVRWIYDRSKIVRDGSGKPHSIIGACLDITRRKQSEQALIDSEARLELAATAADLGIWDWDLRSNRIVYSERAKAIFGFPPGAEVTYQQVRDATHPDDHPRTAAMAARALDPALREREPYEYRILHADGSVRWVLAHGQAVFETRDGVEAAVRYVGTIQDITARKRTEKALGASESRLRLALDAGRMAVWEYDPATDRVAGSAELNRLLGFADDAAPSLDDMRAGYYPGEQERVRAAGQEALARGERFFEVEYRYVRPDSSPRWLLLRAEIQLTAAGLPERVIGVVLDITEQKRAAERQLLLINELNHRVKNTLATIQSIAAQTLRHAPDLARARIDIEARLLGLSRAHDLLTDEGWEGASIAAVIDRVLLPLVSDRGRIGCSGPNIRLTPRLALNLAMTLQELATNAVKYGALATDGGRVQLDWDVAGPAAQPELRMRWFESGGPRTAPPERTGFGTRLIQALAAESGGAAQIRYDAGGVTCSLGFALPAAEQAARMARPE